MADRDRERPSWREIDRMRDGGYRRERRERRERKKGYRVTKGELDKLFESGKIGEVVRRREEEMGLDVPEEPSTRLGRALKIMRIEDDAKFLDQAHRLISEMGPPRHPDFLLRVIEMSDDFDDVLACARTLLQIAEEEGAIESTRSLRGSVMVADVKHMDPELSEIVQKLLRYA